MSKPPAGRESKAAAAEEAAISHLRRSLEDGCEWPVALLEAMALWAVPQETFRGRHNNYFIGGEAFNWLLLAERLLHSVGGRVPPEEKEDLLFAGRFPPSFDTSRFKDLLGVDKYRGYLNYHYGVTVEEALQLAVELEVQKRHASNGIQYRQDFSEDAFQTIYRASGIDLLKRFREETGSPPRRHMNLAESKEFTYWLFNYRMKISDKAKVASDTRKGLELLQRMREESGHTGYPGYVD